MLTNIDDKLSKAREYEAANAFKADPYRPDFHATGGIGWINDPNGFSVYKGEYHLFYQYHPYYTEWGPMHWGHIKTSDFIKWDRLPVAMAPDAPFDKDGCFSGTAIELPDHRQLLMYTGVVKEFHEDGRMDEYQHQCIAIGDGVNYEKLEANPVLDFKDTPEGSSVADYRDPKIWKEGEKYFSLVASRAADKSGQLLMYESIDALSWKFVKIFAECKYSYGTMWECPDFFSLDEKHILIVSPMEMEARGLEFHSGHGVIAMCGEYDKEQREFTKEWVQSVDYGIDFYAPQTLIAPDGRRIMIGWMRNWGTTNLRKADSPIFGSMTLPRELSIRNGRLCANPVRELENYRVNPVHYENVAIKKATALDKVSGRTIDMTVTVTPTKGLEYSYFKIFLAKGENHSASITYRPFENTVTIDRTLASMRSDSVTNRSFYVDSKEGIITLRVVMDKESVELFVNDGEQVATFLIYNDLSMDGIEFMADKEVNITIDKYDIKVD